MCPMYTLDNLNLKENNTADRFLRRANLRERTDNNVNENSFEEFQFDMTHLLRPTKFSTDSYISSYVITLVLEWLAVTEGISSKTKKKKQADTSNICLYVHNILCIDKQSRYLPPYLSIAITKRRPVFSCIRCVPVGTVSLEQAMLRRIELYSVRDGVSPLRVLSRSLLTLCVT